MTACTDLVSGAGEGVAPALRAVDCMSSEATAIAFGRLLGPHGALLPALSAALALYVALFALALLTGRARLGARSLVPHALKIGLVLTFATSWVAYQSVVWTLATGAPDEIASLATGTRGSATQIFAGRVDTLFVAVAEASAAANEQAAARAMAPQGLPGVVPASAPASNTAGVSPASLMWLGATVLLLGTVGVMVTARIVLALLLMIGPVFVVLALFPATRGLCAGWLRATVLAALAPLLAVIGGAFTLELALPAVARLIGPEGIDARAAMAFFLVASVHAALMVLALRTAATIVSGWRVFPATMPTGGREREVGFAASVGGTGAPALLFAHGSGGGAGSVSLPAMTGAAGGGEWPAADRARTRLIMPEARVHDAMAGGTARGRASGIGSRFRARPASWRLR
jgi:type IV secretion system protein VirB6